MTRDEAVVNIPSCVLSPVKDEGPYFIDERLLRSDIRTDPVDGSREGGIPLGLTIKVVRADGDCDPVEAAHVDIWHCNALGIYSDVAQDGTEGRKFLRGCQITDRLGDVRFTTIFPGWYAGRAVHVHLKIRLFRESAATYEFTSQLFFDQDTVDALLTGHSPYDSRGRPDVANAEDGIYGDDGWKLVVPLIPEDREGYSGSTVIGLSDLPQPEENP